MNPRTALLSLCCLSAILCTFSPAARAYVLEGESWTRNRTVVMQLSLGQPRLLSDGSTSFNQVAQSVLDSWNQQLVHLRLSGLMNSPIAPADSDAANSVFFSDTVFGDSFGSGTLAVTVYNSRNSVIEESDTVFNTFYRWDSYRGALRSSEDFRRVALHEFGHVLGLDHPDGAGQTVAAIMNSRVTDVETLQPDDIAGIQALYGSGPAYRNSTDAPVLRNISTRALVGPGETSLIGGFIIQGSQPATVVVRGIGYSLAEVGIANALRDPVIKVFNQQNQQVATSDDWFTGADAVNIASYHLDPRNSLESALLLTLAPGSYTVVVNGLTIANEPTATGVALFELYDLHTTNSRAGNVSSRGQVQGGEDVLIGGFIVGSGGSKEVVVRAIGPSLSSSGISRPLSDPALSLYDVNGTLLRSNDDWQQSPDAAAITSKGLAPRNAKESAFLAALGAGNYTAVVRGVNGAAGIALVEIYDTSTAPQ
ncbi:MAG: matrixin family metalloprotease [Verrucomicrobiota bacterium]|nr:matrixin family metalloprotease [Verrucomicrobiota bacterium]